ncbi:MAG: hypothetical protein JW789_00395 [Candidatus Aenigmarchaeota archaeon]|nr:hypothetical protein [Candidatus Aenigmarchaeota archaeon]
MIGENNANEAIAAFIVVFLLLISSASALDYDSCASSTQVGDGWWDAANCEGGINGYGTLYFKWADAPFSTDIQEVTDSKLIVSGISPGTPFYMYIWNGYSWTRMSGGILDFRGNYVYDIYRIPGPYTDGSMRIKIMNVGPETLYIENLRAVIEYESTIKELTVEVRDCETRKLLQGVEVEADDSTMETDAKGIAVFSLPKYKSFIVTAGDDDFLETSKGVYLTDDYTLEMCVYHDDRYSVDVRSLNIDDGYITFDIKNTGNVESDIRYNVLIDEKEIFSGYVSLNAGKDEDVAAYYNFLPGKYRVRARADSNGYIDSETKTYCVAGLTENYMCSNGKVMREKMTSTCGILWVIVQECSSCESEACAGYGVASPDSSVPAVSSCNVEITSFNYIDGIASNMYQIVEVGVKNTGVGTSSAEVRIYVDNVYVKKGTVSVTSGETVKKEFRFMMTEGTHTLKAEVIACGSVKDTAKSGVGAVRVFSAAVSAGVPEPDPVEEAPSQKAVSRIFIEVDTGETGALYSYNCESVVFKVSPFPPTEEYRVSVTGVPQDWLDYPKTVNALEKSEFYVYIFPQEPGNYTLNVRVWLSDDIEVYDQEEIDLVITSRDGAAITGSNGITGNVSAAGSPIFGVFIALGLIGTIFVLLFLRHSMTGVHGHLPDINMPSYESGMKAAALEGIDGMEYDNSETWNYNNF